MPAADFIGRSLPPRTVVVERGAVASFARAVKDDDAEYADPGAAAPPTFSFVMAHHGTFPELQPPGADAENPMLGALAAVMEESPGLLLHGGQEFTYHRPIRVGDVLTAGGAVKDVRVKESGEGRRMTFIVTETTWSDPAGAPVVTELMTLIVRS